MRYLTLARTMLFAAFVAVLFASGGCARLSTVDSDGLWKVVGGQCVPNQRNTNNPAPCTTVDFTRRYAVLKDLNGRAQYLLIPTDRVGGIESPEILYGGSPEYWQFAWDAGRHVEARLKTSLAANQLGLEINSARRRSQNQLHIHIDCMRADVTDALAQHRGDPPDTWRPVTLDGQHYRVMRVTSLVDRSNPFRVVQRSLGPQQQMSDQTILVTGAGPDAAHDGWLIVHSGLDVDGGSGTAEGLLDHACKVARAS
ncbi:CDP-diacylglycerol diphosphatase [Paraburkholderia caballeronis]|uniref:CDP-diacylglycerol diphosphatase n=1 Tax=Paraburkholderia caballeronis TaxID=416943 RepID=UPI0010670015|nr:CDP-diacylglycerol diphosphatase [Paraburkholderia caballeronis]TDV14986.1 CDP-diacylglycerol pyrophosphatase [Paraburkholderia caballeronis]TDV16890.1 CDP-diacylglycerol pyrophosphatase [Paraburkholderia caballeronis]TDV25722.1 CDP-diacylglycerol pyrophosphatase [Paraburkholderia caballeronis]